MDDIKVIRLFVCFLMLFFFSAESRAEGALTTLSNHYYCYNNQTTYDAAKCINTGASIYPNDSQCHTLWQTFKVYAQITNPSATSWLGGNLQRCYAYSGVYPGNYVGFYWGTGITAYAPCPANSTGSNGACTCSTNYMPNATQTSCIIPVCPAHASGMPCVCDVGYQFDAAGTSCVSTCPVSDLPLVTDPEVQAFENNPDLSDTARLTPRMQTALSCLQTAAAAGSPSVGSAYRPPAYNQHLIDVWKKWFELENGENSADPACANRKAKIRGHFQRHKLLESQQPVPGSLHTLGEAVDVTISLPPANIDALAAGCQLRRPKPVKDRVHFIHQ